MKKVLWLLLFGFLCLLPLGCGKEETLEPTPTPTENEYIVNLNDNIEVYPNRYSTLCGGWMFITNLEDYITAGTVERDGYTEIQVGSAEIAPHEWEEYLTHFTYDSEKENVAKSEFEAVDPNLYGIGNYISSFDDHKFYYEYNAIELADEEISVIFVEGKDALKIRKIFNKVNKYARQTGRGQNIITADDDIFAIISRRLFSRGQILEKIGKNELVNWSSNTLSQRSKQLTTVSALYTIAETLAKDRGWTSKTMPDNKDEIDEVYEENVAFWKALLEGMDMYKKYLELTREDKPVSQLRDDNLLMKPVTHMALAHVAYYAKQKGIEWNTVVEKLNKVNWSMDHSLWFNILVVPAKKKKVITGKESIKAAGLVISYMVMGERMSEDEVAEVREIIRNATNDEKDELPPIID